MAFEFERRNAVRPQRFHGGVAFLARLLLPAGFLQRVDQKGTVFGVVRLAFGGILKMCCGGGVFLALQGKQTEIEWIIILIWIQIARASERWKRVGEISLARPRQCEIVEDLRQVRAADHVPLEAFLQGDENAFGFFRLV